MARRAPIILFVLLVASALAVTPSVAQVGGPLQPPTTGGLPVLLQELRMLGHQKRVLLIAAHPDDEDTELLVMLTRREGAEAAYLSLTRGEGGQNLIGNELGEALGILRTEELMAARNIDGAQQFFTRAYDFGYSKTLADTWAHWPKDSVLKDVVRIIRRFRPQIVVGVFQGLPGDGHGQHQAAGVVTREAYLIAGDSTRFPELQSEEGLAPWTPTKLYRSARFDTAGRTLVFDGGEVEKLSGKTYHQLAMMGRSLHRSQDMGRLQEFGPSISGLERQLPTGPDTGEGWAAFWSGVDTVLKAPREYFVALSDARAAAGRDPRAVMAALRRGQGVLVANPRSIDPATVTAETERLSAALGVVSWVFADLVADQAEVSPGDTLRAEILVRNAGTAPIDLATLFLALDGIHATGRDLPALSPGTARAQAHAIEIPLPRRPTTPYYLAAARAGDLYLWSDTASRGRGTPRGSPGLSATWLFVGDSLGQFWVQRQGSQRILDQAFGEIRRPVVIVPRIGVKLSPGVAVVRTGATGEARTVTVDVTLESGTPRETRGSVTVELPNGWPRPTPVPFTLKGVGAATRVTLRVTVPANASEGEYPIRAVATDGAGKRYDVGAFMVDYPHIRPQQYTRPATAKIEVVDLTPPLARRVGYVRGAADRIPEALAGAGLTVTLLDSTALATADLRGFDAIVVGPRAYEVDSALVRNNDRLLAYARDGGRVIVQYQQQVYLNGEFSPYPLSGNSRIADENAPVTMLGATPSQSALAPVFRTPNAIGPEDWEGWVQDRALYCPTSWGPEFRPLLAMNDPGEAPIRGCLLEAAVGRGSYIYTGLAFFRELPAGVPGAYRLFFNLLGGRVVP